MVFVIVLIHILLSLNLSNNARPHYFRTEFETVEQALFILLCLFQKRKEKPKQVRPVPRVFLSLSNGDLRKDL